MRKIFALFLLITFSTNVRAATASDTWGQVSKTIAINPGTSVSVWKDAYRSLVTNGESTMTAVGDGTYEYIVGLPAGQTYNYIFFVNAGWPAPGGLQAWNDYYDIMPANGVIKCSSNGYSWNEPDTTAYYSSVNYDARRVLNIASSKIPGDTIWVFNNFGETPGVVANFTAAAEGETIIRLLWAGVYGSWGQSGEAFKAADVLAGGYYEIYRGTNETGPFTKINTVEGSYNTYLDTNLIFGDTYYYCIRAVDAYMGTDSTDTFSRIIGDTSTVMNAKARGAIGTFFLVKEADWKIIEKHENIVWFSKPDDPPWCEKIPVRVVRIYLPRGKME